MKKSIKTVMSKGIRIGVVSNLTVLFVGFLCFIAFFTSYKLFNYYSFFSKEMNAYSLSSKAVSEFRDASDFLTEQVRLFSVNLDPVFMERYFQEVNESKRREHSMDVLAENDSLQIAYNDLKISYQESKLLMNKEYYAMRLLAEAIHYDWKKLPQELVAVSLTEEDSVLSDAEKIYLVRAMLFDTEYLFSKERISRYTDHCFSSLSSYYLDMQKTGYKSIKIVFFHLVVLFICIFIVFVGFNILVSLLVLRPLRKHIVNIENNRRMSYEGSYEMRYVASAYNKLCEKHDVTASILRHKAEHDALTGLINREGFSQIKKALTDSGEPLAYLVLDIDFFKQINDSFGHAIGDDVLRKIATLLMEQFRTSDYVARIGGDEFAVIMTKLGKSAKDIIQRKISAMNKVLQENDDCLPPVSLSVGVAFSENGYVTTMELDADKALYQVKNGGRCNCSFYE